MRAYIQDISEITDSRELLESKPQPVIGIFIYALVLLLVIAITWSYFGEIDIAVKAKGVVRPNQKISSIRNKIAGKVESALLEEGAYVKKGDILFTVEHTVLDLQKQALSTEYDKSTRELKSLEKFKQSILEGENLFSSLDSEKEYYNRFEKYKTDLEVQSRQVELDATALSYAEKELAGLNILKQSVLKNENLFTEEDSTYSNQYVDYILNLKNRKETLNQKKQLVKSSEELAGTGAISSQELENVKEELTAAEINLQKYQNEFMLNINTKMDDCREKLNQLRINLKTSSNGTYIPFPNELTIGKYKMDAIVQAEADIKALGANLDKLKNDLDTTNANIKDCTVLSPIDGYINISSEVNTGDLLQSGMEVATIVPETSSAYKVQLYVSNADIASLKRGQKIKYQFLALPYREYGELTGYVENLGTDARVDQSGGTSYYTAEASVENKQLYSYKGVVAQIKVGMECEAQVVTKTKKVLYYLLEKINLRD
ncbi:MAG TPA: HlyD family efflux transporter periplasmic adaptor subunit [Ruminiclostridium sp.]|nr:HlyD family efflux transporter periplasmic adaptor subunit [Ruminiclostridium sp.]